MHTRAHTHTSICSVTSSALLSAEQMQQPARQLVVCDDFLWALCDESSWVPLGSEREENMWTREQKQLSLSPCEGEGHFEEHYWIWPKLDLWLHHSKCKNSSISWKQLPIPRKGQNQSTNGSGEDVHMRDFLLVVVPHSKIKELPGRTFIFPPVTIKQGKLFSTHR